MTEFKEYQSKLGENAKDIVEKDGKVRTEKDLKKVVLLD